jgi:hypothetical protein
MARCLGLLAERFKLRALQEYEPFIEILKGGWNRVAKVGGEFVGSEKNDFS